MPNQKHSQFWIELIPVDSVSDDLIESMDIYRTTKEIYDSTNVALGRSFEYSVFNSSSKNVNIEVNEHTSTATTCKI